MLHMKNKISWLWWLWNIPKLTLPFLLFVTMQLQKPFWILVPNRKEEWIIGITASKILLTSWSWVKERPVESFISGLVLWASELLIQANETHIFCFEANSWLHTNLFITAKRFISVWFSLAFSCMQTAAEKFHRNNSHSPSPVLPNWKPTP